MRLIKRCTAAKWLPVVLVLLNSAGTPAQTTAELSDSNTLQQRMAWWKDARFGMFLHWGVYAGLGGVWNGTDYGKEMGDASSEWIFLTAAIQKQAYRKYAEKFNPKNFDPSAWVNYAKQAGMKYMVLTAKHHDGFALFDTKYSNWNVLQASPYKKDIIRAYVNACHQAGMRVGLYFSHEKDWYHSKKVRHNAEPLQQSYIELVRKQLTELLTNYGKIDLIWFDMGINAHENLNLMCRDIVRKLQPDCIISGRIGSGLGDYRNLGDRELAPPGMNGFVESIMTLRLNWAYDNNDANWKSSTEVIKMISKTACRNSNFLLNIGPQPDGDFTPEEKIRLANIGAWMKNNGDAIYATQGAPFKGEYPWGSLTTAGNKVYLHLFGDIPKTLRFPALRSKVDAAQMLSSGQAVAFEQADEHSSLTIHLDSMISNSVVPIIALTLDSVANFDLAKGPDWLPPIERHQTRKQISGVVENMNGSGFDLKATDTTMHFSLNENIEYRLQKGTTIEITNGFNLIAGKPYTVVYEPGLSNVLKIILSKNPARHR
ncbi:alpha-L-fucosidase [Niabella insulamsoli]|uniref:alpha-L-fucosidase n=1 Tax=Niabella insulamsoli TaxID=3144874 RepID=UPI0031FE1553